MPEPDLIADERRHRYQLVLHDGVVVSGHEDVWALMTQAVGECSAEQSLTVSALSARAELVENDE